MKYKITVRFKEGVFNPEGDTVKRTLNKLGYEEVSSVQVERSFILEAEEGLSGEKIEAIASDILSNPVIEDWELIKG